MTNGRVTIREVYDLIQELRKDMAKKYVRKEEFAPVRTLVYGMVGLIVMAVGTAMIAGVVRAWIM